MMRFLMSGGACMMSDGCESMDIDRVRCVYRVVCEIPV